MVVTTRAGASMADTEQLHDEIEQLSKTLCTKIDGLTEKLTESITRSVKTVLTEYIDQIKAELLGHITGLEQRILQLENNPPQPVNERECSFVVVGMAESENENVSLKLNNLLSNELKLKDVQLTDVDRKPKYNNSDCGVIVAKCANIQQKGMVMEAKSLLRNSAHNSHIKIFPDKPKWQRQQEANVRMVVRALGPDKLSMRGNRVCLSDENQNMWHNNNGGRGRGHARGYGRGRGQGRGNGRGGGRGRGQGRGDGRGGGDGQGGANNAQCGGNPQ